MADPSCTYCGGTGEVPESSTRYMRCPKCCAESGRAEGERPFHRKPKKDALADRLGGDWSETYEE